jgi:putative glutamine amidotransferase
VTARSAHDGGVAPPLIGLTTSEVRTAKTLRPIPHGEPTPHEFALAIPYVRAVELAGGLPVIVPPLGDVALEPLLDCLDGLCLPGGPDMDPAAYGESPHRELGPVDRDVDRFELAMARAADERELPILGICRGAELLNVARGGSLIQHLPDLGKRLPHRQDTPGTETSHPVAVVTDSLLGEITAADELQVNSFHHQGIGKLGHNLRPVAAAPDDTVEALEATDRDFCLGVQWHAETLVHMEPQFALFGAFVEAAAGTRALAARRAA